eukprot:TRINITY_DN5118_c0_g2_i1.p1 TRINITY_DN5118_c0_g2~~TRINITY_DN5118_c0_g2_i1.p1  ORF type:complete len:904 (+),score=169.72 TRINITY_DN5118_c0_g2_i1:131-2713(+)
MKGSSLLFCFVVGLAVFCFTPIQAADFTGITCDITINNSSDFQTFFLGQMVAAWSGNKNVCFNEGLISIPTGAATQTIISNQTWYGAQWRNDPTCGGSFNPNCDRWTSAKTSDTTKETILSYSPSSQVTFGSIIQNSAMTLIGLSITSSNSDYFLWIVNGPITLTNVYTFCTAGNVANKAVDIWSLSSTFSVNNNYFDSAGTTGSRPFEIFGSGIVSNNIFQSNTGFWTHTGAVVTVTGNVFLGGPASTNIRVAGGSNFIHNNTFIYPYRGVYFSQDGSEVTTIDNNLFVFSYSYGSYTSPYTIYINANVPVDITNNRFAGPSVTGSIYNHNPRVVAYNDFVDNSIILNDSTWNVSHALVHDNYFGPYGPWNLVGLSNPVNNNRIPSVYVETNSNSVVDYITTPNNPDLPDEFVKNMRWYAVGQSRPYFVVGDTLNVTFSFNIPSWYGKYNIPTAYWTQLAYSSAFRLYGSANGLYKTVSSSVICNLGDNWATYTPISSHLTALGSQYGYFIALRILGTKFATYPAVSIFSQEPVSFTFNTQPTNGYFYSNQGVIKANIYTDAYITNVTISLVNHAHHKSLPVTFLSSGTGVGVDYTLPVQSTTNVTAWQLTATFTLVTGEHWTIDHPTLFGYDEVKPPPNCYGNTITVDKGLQKMNSVQSFALSDLGCITPDWQIVSVNHTNWYDYENHKVFLNISAVDSGDRPVHYQIADVLSGTVVHNIITNITIVNHNPVINSATFTWTYPRTSTVFPNWNLLSGCADPDGDSLSVVQIQRTKGRSADSVQQIDPFTLYYVPEKAVLRVAPTGEISLTSPNLLTTPISPGAPLALFWKKDLGFQFEITDGDVNRQNAWGTASINSN